MDVTDALEAVRLFDPPRWLRRALADEGRPATVEVDGTPIRWWSWGDPQASGQPVLLLHGFRANSSWWHAVAPLLAEDRHVVAFDFGGMGHSGPRDDYRRATAAREILAVINAACLQSPAVVAHSFGGTIAMIAAAMAPERFGRLILVDSTLELLVNPGVSLLTGAEPTASQTFPTRDAALRRFRLVPTEGDPDPHLLLHVAEASIVETEQGWRWRFDDENYGMLRAEPGEVLGHPSIVPDILHGADSDVAVPERLAEIARGLPRCGEPVAIPVARHHPQLDQPLAVVAAIRALLAGAAAGAAR